MVPPHRIQRDSHGSALLAFLDDDNFTPLRVVPTAVGAYEVGTHGFAAAVAIGVATSLEVLVTSTFSLAGLGDAPLWYSHDSELFLKNGQD
jgi:hypothetical protein